MTANGIDTGLYLGNSVTGSNRPTINADYGLFFEGQQFAVIKSSGTHTLYSNEFRYTGASLTMWAYIMDGSRDQVLFCKQNRNSGNAVSS